MSHLKVLKGYMFCWRSLDGIQALNGTIYYPVQKRVVIATSKKEAREIFKTRDREFEKMMRDQNKLPCDINKLVKKVLTRCELTIREFPLERGQTA